MSQGTSSAEEEADAGCVVTSKDPDYITYLLDPEQEYNCYFLVGKPELKNVERIGVVKKMLLAHSVVLRAELQDSKIAEKNDVKVTDIFPKTFKNLLRYIYGYDNTQDLDFDDADNLLYAAEKYMMPKLKNRLATRLLSLLDYNNICSLMNNPACYSVLELNCKITEILQTETDKVLDSPQFLELSSFGLLKILEQEVLNESEVNIWMSVVNWAEKRGRSSKGRIMRNALKKHLQYIRFCAMTNDDIVMEVVPTKILSYDELIMVSESRRSGEVQPNLTTICNVIQERERPLIKSELMTQSLCTGSYSNLNNRYSESTLIIKTLDVSVELCSVKLYNYNMSSHQCTCTITIQKNTEPPIVSRFVGQISQSNGYEIPILVDDKNVQLSSNSSYSIKLTFPCASSHGCAYKNSPYNVSGSHFSVEFVYHQVGYYIFHVSTICYKTITKNVKTIQSLK